MTKKITALFSALFLVLTLSLALPLESDAARMGGGKSFGSQPAMRAPTRAPMVQQTAPRQGAPTNQAAAVGQPARGGLFSGFGGGLLGGLLAGTLIGSLLGGGAFNGVGFMDILLILAIVGGIVFFLRRRRASQPAAQTAHGGTYADNANSYVHQRNAQGSDAWGALRGTPQGGSAACAAPQANVPEGFDVEDFLRGAKMAYTRMQAAWDKRDLDDIANFATEAVLEELAEQKRQDPEPSRTEIVLINASLLSVEEFGSQDRAQVYFDVLMREDPNQTQPANAREIWHFVRAHETGNWKLDGIQQVESC